MKVDYFKSQFVSKHKGFINGKGTTRDYQVVIFYERYKGIMAYGFWGIMTTIINIVTYFALSRFVHLGISGSTVVAWLISVIFAYCTNRKWVFHSQVRGKKEIIIELFSFVSCRLATGVLDWTIMFVFVDYLQLPDMIFKVGANVLVIVLNYIASKLVIFKSVRK